MKRLRAGKVVVAGGETSVSRYSICILCHWILDLPKVKQRWTGIFCGIA